MMTAPETCAIYKSRLEELATELKSLKKKKDLVAATRLFLLLLAIAVFFYLRTDSLKSAIVADAILLIIFVRQIMRSTNLSLALVNVEQLMLINRVEIQILSGNFRNLPSGQQFLTATHDYAQDLDIFGHASLFQYVNRTSSEQGNRKLADWLMAPSTTEQILERQEAVKELTAAYQWRQQLQAHGNLNRITENTEKKIGSWLQEPDRFQQPYWKWLSYLLPALTCSILVFYIFDLIPDGWFYLLVLIFFLSSSAISKAVTPVYVHLDKIVKEISSLSETIEWIEKRSFNASRLHSLQRQLISDKKPAASESLRKLREILDRMDYRNNPVVFIPLNTFLFWDLHQVLQVEKWKKLHASEVSGWFNAVAEIEAIASLANLSFNHHDWCFPALTTTDGTLSASDLAHPLIPFGKRIPSSFSTSGIPQIALITGSNMAGKSTFLRSVGVNIVLAMMGSPVCARSFSLAPVKVMSSMRVTDNLEESASTFYAELKKLKQIIEAVNRKEKVFLLLDEILRGTNSLDRHTGSKALIRQLLQHDAVGMLATHDLELARLSEEYPGKINNYHFDVQVAGEELFFDYQLKEGVCESMNASILMKKIGIEL